MGRIAWKRAPRVGALFILAAIGLYLLAANGLQTPTGGTEATRADEQARVAKVVDGDTVILADGRHVRLIGINTPEKGRKRAPAEPFAHAARNFVAKRIANQTVGLVYGRERRDRHGRTLAHVLLPDGNDLQEALLREGLAVAVAVPPNINRLSRYLDAERVARAAGRGVWGDAYFAPRPAQSLDRGDTGFRFIRGTVGRVGQSRKYIYFDLARDVSLQVPREDYERYWRGAPDAWRGAKVEARGWLSDYNDKLRMRLHHPGMVRRIVEGGDHGNQR